MKLDDGYYWIKLTSESPWEVAEIRHDIIWRTGVEYSDFPDTVWLIGDKIEEPIEDGK